RRRHTRFSRDWSSDVCSSDLQGFLDQVLDGFDAWAEVPGKARDHARAQYFGGCGVDFAGGLAGGGNGMDDFGAVEGDDPAVALKDLFGHHGWILHVVWVWVGYYYILWVESRSPPPMPAA